MINVPTVDLAAAVVKIGNSSGRDIDKFSEFGLTPKEAARTMRFTHAVTRIGEGVRGGSLDLAALAAECGYADQPHLDREFRAFAGTSPSGWIAEEFPNIQAGGHRYARDWES